MKFLLWTEYFEKLTCSSVCQEANIFCTGVVPTQDCNQLNPFRNSAVIAFSQELQLKRVGAGVFLFFSSCSSSYVSVLYCMSRMNVLFRADLGY